MKKMIQSIIIFLTTIMLFSALVFAWFTITYQSDIQEASYNVIRRDVNLNVEFGKNGGSYNSFDEPAEINAYLQSTLPGDIINIRVTIVNTNPIGQPDMDVIIELDNIRSSLIDGDYDLTDFFYIEDFEVHLIWYENMTQYEFDIPLQTQTIILNQLNEDTLIYQGLPLYNERMSNLFYMQDIEGEMTLINNIPITQTVLQSQQILVVQFNIGFDPYTPSDGGFQDAELLIDGLYVFIE